MATDEIFGLDCKIKVDRLNLMRHNLAGTVVGIMSGDSVIIRFDPGQDVPKIQIVSLEHLIGPKFGSADGQISDEPHGFDSWNFMRKLCIGKRVSVLAPNKRVDMARSHPAFGRLPLFFSRIALGDDDLGLLCLRAGWIKIRAPKVRDFYVNCLFQAEAEAREARLGIWRKNGYIRELPVTFNPRDLIVKGEFDAVVDSVVNGTTLSLFLLPNHEHIIFRVAACRAASAKKEASSELGFEAKEFTISHLLHRMIRVRLCSCNENDLFIGPILDLSDIPIRRLLALGLASFNVHTADLTPSCYEYERLEQEAKSKRLKMWEDEPEKEQLKVSFDGVVTQIVGSCTLNIDVHGDSRLVQFSCLKTPDYVAGGGSESLGFEAREYLRKLLIGQEVSVVVDGIAEKRYYGTVMLDEEECVNVMICRQGLAFVMDPIVGRVSSMFGKMKEAQDVATSERIGLWAAVTPQPNPVHDLSVTIYPDDALSTLNRLRGHILHGIVEQILGGNRFIVFVPREGLMLRLAVNGLLPISPSDLYGRQATEYSIRKFLNRDIEFDLHEVDKSGGFLANMYLDDPNEGRENIAKFLLFAGLAEVHKRTVKGIPNDEELLEAQAAAQEMGMGKWSDSKCDRVQLEFDSIYPVRVIDVIDCSTVTVQFVQTAMKEVFTLLPAATTAISHSDLKVGDLVGVVVEENRYRARIEVIYESHVKVMLVDYDVIVEAKTDSVFELPPRLLSIEPQAMTVKLAFVDDMERKSSDIEYVKSLTTNAIMYMSLCYVSDIASVLLLEKPDMMSGSLNGMIVRNTSVQLIHTDLNLDSDLKQVVTKLEQFWELKK